MKAVMTHTSALPTQLPGAVLVATVDVSRPLDGIDGGAGYEQAWILVLYGGAPLGLLQVPIDAAGISAAELTALARDQLGDAWALAAHARPDRIDDARLPRISVVVPTTAARGEQLVNCATRLAGLDYPDFEVIVVDNRGGPGAGDDALTTVASLPGVRVIEERRPGISAARNAGLVAADGEIVAYTDDDVEVDPRWLRALGSRFAVDRDVDAVTGLVMPKELETPAQLWFERSGSGLDRSFVALTFESAARGHTSAGAFWHRRFQVVRRAAGSASGTVASLYATGEFGLGSNMAFRTAALRSLGGFDLALGAGTATCGGEDLAILLELLMNGRKLVYEPSAIVNHIHRREVAELERQIHGYGVGLTATLVALLRRDPRHVFGILAVLPAALRSLVSSSSGKRAKQSAGYPVRLLRAERRGMLAGPWAYARSRRLQRRWATT